MTIAHHKGENGLKRTKYKCDVCGNTGFWSDSWSYYGSFAHIEECPSDLPSACSDECADVMMKKIESGEWVLPVLRSRTYYFNVVEPRKGY